MTSDVLPVPVRFALVGAANTAVGLAAIYSCKLLGASDVVANMGGYGIGLTLSFVLNRNWSFRHAGAVAPAIARFAAIFAAAYAFNLGTVLALTQRFGVNGYLAQAAGVLPYVTLFYLGSRYIVFR